MRSMIEQIGIFMICAQTIMHFRPKEVYGKYLRLLFSVMILVQILQPFSNLFFGGSGIEMQKSIQQFQSKLDESMAEAARRAAFSEEQLQRMSLEEVQERITAQEAESGNAEIEIEPMDRISVTTQDTESTSN